MPLASPTSNTPYEVDNRDETPSQSMARLENSNNTNNNGSYGTLGATDIVAQPVLDMQERMYEFLSLRAFWRDMERRQREPFHKATLVLGFSFGFVAVAYCITVLTLHNHADQYDPLLWFVTSEVLIAAVAQVIYTSVGICVENSGMLLMANVNAIGITIRIGLTTASMGFQDPAIDATFCTLFSVLTCALLATSSIAWGGGMSRFMMFCVGTDEVVQYRFRFYQFFIALSAIDLQFSIMAADACFVAMAHNAVWWRYLLIAVALLSNLLTRALTRVMIRREEIGKVWIVAFLYVGYTVFVATATLTSYFDAKIPLNGDSFTLFTIVLHIVSRAAMFVGFGLCVRNFGLGMREVFEQQKSARQYLASLKPRYQRYFLEEGEAPPSTT